MVFLEHFSKFPEQILEMQQDSSAAKPKKAE